MYLKKKVNKKLKKLFLKILKHPMRALEKTPYFSVECGLNLMRALINHSGLNRQMRLFLLEGTDTDKSCGL